MNNWNKALIILVVATCTFLIYQSITKDRRDVDKGVEMGKRLIEYMNERAKDDPSFKQRAIELEENLEKYPLEEIKRIAEERKKAREKERAIDKTGQ